MRAMHACKWAILLSLFGLITTARGHAQERGQEASDTEHSLSPYFFIEGAHDETEAFPLESTEVVANVSGVIADVTVQQTYRNDGSTPINARYVFPASTRAAVHGMEFRVGNKRVVA